MNAKVHILEHEWSEPFTIMGVPMGSRVAFKEGFDEHDVAFGYVPNDIAKAILPGRLVLLCKNAAANKSYGLINIPKYAIQIDVRTGAITFFHDYGRSQEDDRCVIDASEINWSRLFDACGSL